MLGVLEAVMSQDERPVSINISRIPVAGIGGLGLVAMAVVVSIFFRPLSWAMIAALVGGVAIGLALVFWRRTH